MALTRESRATELSINVLQDIITAIQSNLELFRLMRECGNISDEDYSLLETNWNTDIKAYQEKIEQLTATINQEETWKD